MNNVEIRTLAKLNRVCLWEIAEELGMADSNFSKKLRKELPKEEREKIIKIIYEITDKKKYAMQA